MTILNYTAQKYASENGLNETEVIAKIEIGELDGYEYDGYWYVKVETEETEEIGSISTEKTFDVYKHPILGYQAVKKGFGWPAFFFGAIWAFVKKMWGLGFAFLGVIFLLAVVEKVLEQEGSQDSVLVILFVYLAFYIVVGVKGNDWRRGNLVKRGFEKLNTVEAKTPDAAIGLVAKLSTEQKAEIA